MQPFGLFDLIILYVGKQKKWILFIFVYLFIYFLGSVSLVFVIN